MKDQIDFAVKFESIEQKRSQVFEEAKLLKGFEGEKGFPKFMWFG